MDEAVSTKKKINFMPWLFIAPHLLIFIVFFLVPIFFGLYVSFTSWNMMDAPKWVGLANYKEMLFDHGSLFYQQLHNGLKNTFIFVLLSVPACLIVPMALAVALNTKPRLSKFFQALFYLPSLFAISAVIIVWNLMFDATYGPINHFLTHKNIVWIGTQPYAWITLIVVTVWWCIGGNMIIYQAALNSIPKDYYEVASLDGATKWQQFIHITLSSIKGQILYTLVMTTIAQFNIYGQPLMLTKGGPNSSTSVLLMYIQQDAFGNGGSIAGMASAMAIILGFCIMIVSGFQFYLLRQK